MSPSARTRYKVEPLPDVAWGQWVVLTILCAIGVGMIVNVSSGFTAAGLIMCWTVVGAAWWWRLRVPRGFADAFRLLVIAFVLASLAVFFADWDLAHHITHHQHHVRHGSWIFSADPKVYGLLAVVGAGWAFASAVKAAWRQPTHDIE